MRLFGRDISRNRCIIVGELCALVLLATLGIYMWRDCSVRAFVMSSDNVADASNYEWFLDTVSRSTKGDARTDYLSITGWVVEPGVDSKEAGTEITVILQNVNTQEYYRIPTTQKRRTDITAYYYDGNSYDNSGFTFEIPMNARTGLTADTDYGIYLLVKTHEGEVLVDTGSTVDGWIAAHA